MLSPVQEIPSYAVIIRAIWERGRNQSDALAELSRRGLWLTDDQKRQAGIAPYFNHGLAEWQNMYRGDGRLIRLAKLLKKEV